MTIHGGLKAGVLEVPVIRGRVLGVTVYRGYARICDLASISKADVYDQKTNPTGTQRDLSPKHARDAYEYVKTRDMAFWPEVFLCARSSDVIEYCGSDDSPDIGIIQIRLNVATDPKQVAISRVDGNHRLHYMDGRHDGYEPIEKTVSFCLAEGLTLEQEITLFRDINDNQRRMNTSHLDNIEARLTPEERQKREHPDLYIAQLLGRDESSPLHGLVYEGGTKAVGQIVPLRTLRTGVQYMLSRPTKLTALNDTDAEYMVIRNYFGAVKQWQPQAWSEPKKYLVLRGAGLWGVCFLCAEVADRVLTRGKFASADMLQVLRSGRDWDWGNKGAFQGLSGRGGAAKICDMITTELADESGFSLRELHRAILQQ